MAEALPVLEEQADVIGPRGRESVDLLGTSPQFAHAGGPLLRHFSTEQLAHQKELGLPAPVAKAIGAESLQPIEIQVGTHVTSTLLGATLQEGDIGALVNSPVAIAPVGYAEELAGTTGRVTRIFVHTEPGREAQVRAALVRLAAGRLNVEPANFDSTLFAKAAAPANQSAELFSAITALVGFMFAFNAMLITAQLRRELIGELRRHGATRWMTISTLLFDALILGALGCILGLALGDAISRALFHTNPGYLSYAFPVGSRRVVTWQSVALAVAAGMLAACVGVLVPLRGELARPLRRRGRSRGGVPRRRPEMAGGTSGRRHRMPGGDDGDPRLRARERDPREPDAGRGAAVIAGAPLRRGRGGVRAGVTSAAIGRDETGGDRAAHPRDADTLARDRRHRSGRGVRQRRDRRRAQQPAERP